jgi:23S rRNA pseudouridine2605 synthase
MQERLQKYMANCGVASRRKCEELILDGCVKVNGSTICELGYKVTAEVDIVEVSGKLIKPVINKLYIALNKPVGYVSTVKDERNRKTIIDLININERIYPIGRLDYDTSGLILLTNDGEIYNRIIHPRVEVNKVYIAKVKGMVSNESIRNLEKGVDIGDYITAPAKVQVINKSAANSEIKIIIHEGKNRQVRRMCEAVGHPVITLSRISIGEIQLGSLKLGKWRYLSESEMNYLRKL